MWRKRLLLVVIGVLTALGLCEAVVRWLDLAPEVALISLGRFRLSTNPMMGYEPVPDFEYSGEDLQFYEFRGKSNRLGFRDRDHALRKEPGVRRIIVLGDSITMGLFIDRTEDVFTSVLERTLRERNKNVEVLNFGVSGYNTQQEVALLVEKGLALDPDVVVLAYCLNDQEEMNGGIMTELREGKKESRGVERSMLAPWLVRSALYRLVYARVLAASAEEARRNYRMLLKLDTVEPSLQRLRHAADAGGFAVVVAVFPPREGHRPPEYHQRIFDLCASNRLDSLDLRVGFRECEKTAPEKLLRDAWHPSVSGHACAGRAIADHLISRGLAD